MRAKVLFLSYLSKKYCIIRKKFGKKWWILPRVLVIFREFAQNLSLQSVIIQTYLCSTIRNQCIRIVSIHSLCCWFWYVTRLLLTRFLFYPSKDSFLTSLITTKFCLFQSCSWFPSNEISTLARLSTTLCLSFHRNNIRLKLKHCLSFVAHTYFPM